MRYLMELSEVSLVCPENDLESVTIINIARELHIDTRISRQKWGARLGSEPDENLKNLKKTVLVVEMFDPPAEEALHSVGHEVKIIDHHDYSGESRWNPKSSLEQFCLLTGYPMTDELRRIAVNDTDFIYGLFRLGLSYHDMEQVRIDERKVMGTDVLFDEAVEFVEKNRQRLTDLDVIKAPYRFHEVLSEAAQWVTEGEYEKAQKDNYLELPNCLLIFHDDTNEDRVVQVEYFGDLYYFESFREMNNDHEVSLLFNTWSGKGSAGCYWGAVPKDETHGETDRLIDRVLSFTLIRGRPLRHYSASFLFPFSLKDDYRDFSIEDISDADFSAQEQLFFLPEVQRFLFHPGKEDMEKRSLTLKTEDEKRLKVFIKSAKEPSDFPIQDINLYSFFNNVHILEIRVCQCTDPDIWKDPFWKQLINKGSQYESPNFITLEEALVFNRRARILYPTFIAQDEEEKIFQKIEWKRGITYEPTYLSKGTVERTFSPIVIAMIQGFFKDKRKVRIDFNTIWDDRMFVHSSLALAGDKPEIQAGKDRYHALFTTAAYVDDFNDNWKDQDYYCYDAEFIKDMIEPHTYKRWFGPSGNLYGFTRYSAVYMAFGYDFHKKYIPIIDRMYLLLSVLSLYYKTTLLRLNYRVSRLDNISSRKDESKKEKNLDTVQDVHWELTNFSNRYWFREVTSQDQGIEIFDLYNKAMELQTEYNAVKQKIERIFSVLDSDLKSRLQTVPWRIGIMGLLFTIASLTTGITGYFLRKDVIFDDTLHTVLFWVSSGLTIIGVVTALVFLWYIFTRFGWLKKLWRN